MVKSERTNITILPQLKHNSFHFMLHYLDEDICAPRYLIRTLYTPWKQILTNTITGLIDNFWTRTLVQHGQNSFMQTQIIKKIYSPKKRIYIIYHTYFKLTSVLHQLLELQSSSQNLMFKIVSFFLFLTKTGKQSVMNRVNSKCLSQVRRNSCTESDTHHGKTKLFAYLRS